MNFFWFQNQSPKNNLKYGHPCEDHQTNSLEEHDIIVDNDARMWTLFANVLISNLTIWNPQNMFGQETEFLKHNFHFPSNNLEDSFHMLNF
jgi:hypothetical protein